jgi:hypothetical protein
VMLLFSKLRLRPNLAEAKYAADTSASFAQ